MSIVQGNILKMGLKKTPQNVVLWCFFDGIRSWGQSSPKGHLLALVTHLLGYCKQKVAKNLYLYYFFKRKPLYSKVLDQGFPQFPLFSQNLKRIKQGHLEEVAQGHVKWTFLFCFCTERPFSCVWITAPGELRPKFLWLSHLSFPLPCEMPNWYVP